VNDRLQPVENDMLGCDGALKERGTMKIKAAVLNKMGAELPYAKSKPLTIEEVELDGPEREEIEEAVTEALDHDEDE